MEFLSLLDWERQLETPQCFSLIAVNIIVGSSHSVVSFELLLRAWKLKMVMGTLSFCSISYSIINIFTLTLFKLELFFLPICVELYLKIYYPIASIDPWPTQMESRGIHIGSNQLLKEG